MSRRCLVAVPAVLRRQSRTIAVLPDDAWAARRLVAVTTVPTRNTREDRERRRERKSRAMVGRSRVATHADIPVMNRTVGVGPGVAGLLRPRSRRAQSGGGLIQQRVQRNDALLVLWPRRRWWCDADVERAVLPEQVVPHQRQGDTPARAVIEITRVSIASRAHHLGTCHVRGQRRYQVRRVLHRDQSRDLVGRGRDGGARQELARVIRGRIQNTTRRRRGRQGRAQGVEEHTRRGRCVVRYHRVVDERHLQRVLH